MQWLSSLFSACLAVGLVVINPSSAEFTECLGIEVSQLASIPSCVLLYEACESGVAKLNAQLQEAPDQRFHPVSVVSATRSHAQITNDTLVAMLVQLAPLDECIETPGSAPNESSKKTCAFDMKRLEMYSLLMTLTKAPSTWSLDGFKHHALTADERAQIVAEYKDGNFYGSNLALAVFDTPQLPSENASEGDDKAMSRSPVGLFAVIASATISIGLLFHHRRRLHNGYAPIVIMKRGQLQGRNAAATPQPTPQRSLSTPGTARTEGTALTRETSERFAV
ncbi:hypothetical protein PINS_up001766 [Pythium insidiosum]|nr:hypothetical protein PINS_up001766 [Pythium insidiosum]